MSDPPSWRDLLKRIIDAPGERERIANEIGVRSITLDRWIAGTSKPRMQNLRQLQHALPKVHKDQLTLLLEEEHIDLTDPETSETRATAASNLLFWTLCRKVILHALRRLDPERNGMAITLVQCMPVSSEGKVRSLRESVGVGTPPWPGDLEHQSMFLGAESLAGYVVTNCRQGAINDLRINTTFLPAYQVEYEVSALAHPIMYTNRIAGCLLLSSTQADYFLSESRLALVSDYTQLLAQVLTLVLT